MPQPSSRPDQLVEARIASCLTLAVSAGRRRVLDVDLSGRSPFLASRLRGAVEALLATNHLDQADRAHLADPCARLGWDVVDGRPFGALAADVGGATASGGLPLRAGDRDAAACSALMACVRLRSADPAPQTPDGLDHRIGAAVDYLTLARLLHPADAARACDVLQHRGVTVHDPTFTALYDALNAELEDVLRELRPGNYTWRGRAVGWWLQRMSARAASDPRS